MGPWHASRWTKATLCQIKRPSNGRAKTAGLGNPHPPRRANLCVKNSTTFEKANTGRVRHSRRLPSGCPRHGAPACALRRLATAGSANGSRTRPGVTTSTGAIPIRRRQESVGEQSWQRSSAKAEARRRTAPLDARRGPPPAAEAPASDLRPRTRQPERERAGKPLFCKINWNGVRSRCAWR